MYIPDIRQTFARHSTDIRLTFKWLHTHSKGWIYIPDIQQTFSRHSADIQQTFGRHSNSSIHIHKAECTFQTDQGTKEEHLSSLPEAWRVNWTELSFQDINITLSLLLCRCKMPDCKLTHIKTPNPKPQQGPSFLRKAERKAAEKGNIKTALVPGPSPQLLF